MKKYLPLLIYVPILFVVASCKKQEAATPTANVDFTITYPAKTLPESVTFTATSNIAATFAWNFGDGTTQANGSTVTHSYTAFGYFPVTLSGTNDGGTSTKIKYANTSPYSEILINSLTVLGVPPHKPDGSNWDVDGSLPDLKCKLTYSLGTYTTVIAGNTLAATFNFIGVGIPNIIGDSLKVDVYDDDTGVSLVDDFIVSATFDKFTSLITDHLPYATTATIVQSGITINLAFTWN